MCGAMDGMETVERWRKRLWEEMDRSMDLVLFWCCQKSWFSDSSLRYFFLFSRYSKILFVSGAAFSSSEFPPNLFFFELSNVVNWRGGAVGGIWKNVINGNHFLFQCVIVYIQFPSSWAKCDWPELCTCNNLCGKPSRKPLPMCLLSPKPWVYPVSSVTPLR